MIELERLDRRQAFRLLDFYRKAFVESMHDLAGFPGRTSHEMYVMTWLFMPKTVPEREIIETGGYAKMLRAVLEGSQRKIMPSYSKMFTFPLNARLGIPEIFPEPPMTGADDFARDLAGGFSFVSEIPFLGKHGLPPAFLWANSEMCRAGFKPFTAIGGHAREMRRLSDRGGMGKPFSRPSRPAESLKGRTSGASGKRPMRTTAAWRRYFKSGSIIKNYRYLVKVFGESHGKTNIGIGVPWKTPGIPERRVLEKSWI